MLATRFSPQYSGQGWNARGFPQTGLTRNENFSDGFGGALREVENEEGRRFGAEKTRRADQRSRKRQARRSRSRNAPDDKNENGEMKKETKKTMKMLGLVLALTSSATISLGVSNTAITATTVMTSASDSGCFKESQWYEQLGPKDDIMRGLDWSWVTVGLWSAILTYLAAMIASKITNKSNKMMKFLTIATIVSLIGFLPIRIVFSVLDTLLSSSCQESNTAKFALPIVVAVLGLVEFIILFLVFRRIKQQVKDWKKESEEEESEQPKKRTQRKYRGSKPQEMPLPITNIFFPSQTPVNHVTPVLMNRPQMQSSMVRPVMSRAPFGQGAPIARRWAPRVANRPMIYNNAHRPNYYISNPFAM